MASALATDAGAIARCHTGHESQSDKANIASGSSASISNSRHLLVCCGDLPQPDFDAIAKQVAPSIITGGSAIAGLAIVTCCVLTAIAPFIYAARSGDVFTIVVSIVALVVCFVLLASRRTVIGMLLAAIIYFTSLHLRRYVLDNPNLTYIESSMGVHCGRVIQSPVSAST